MACKLVISYRSGRPRGDIVTVVSGDTRLGKYASLYRWLETGGTVEDWPRNFTVIVVTDKDVSDLFKYSEKSVETGQGIYSVGVPPEGTEEYESLRTTGQFECEWSKVEQYLEVR